MYSRPLRPMASRSRASPNQQLQAGNELIAVRVLESAVAAHAVLNENGAASVDEHRSANRHGLQREQRQTLVRRRTDDDGRRLQGLHALRSDSRPAKRTNGSSGSAIASRP